MSEYRLYFVEPENAESLFDYYITPRLEKFAERFPTEIDIGFVRGGCLAGALTTAIIQRENEVVGAVLLCPLRDLYNPSLLLHVLFLTIDPGHNLSLWLDTQLEQYAREVGYRRLTAQSPRKGWLPVAQAAGWSPEAFLWSKAL